MDLVQGTGDQGAFGYQVGVNGHIACGQDMDGVVDGAQRVAVAAELAQRAGLPHQCDRGRPAGQGRERGEVEDPFRAAGQQVSEPQAVEDHVQDFPGAGRFGLGEQGVQHAQSGGLGLAEDGEDAVGAYIGVGAFGGGRVEGLEDGVDRPAAEIEAHRGEVQVPPRTPARCGEAGTRQQVVAEEFGDRVASGSARVPGGVAARAGGLLPGRLQGARSVVEGADPVPAGVDPVPGGGADGGQGLCAGVDAAGHHRWRHRRLPRSAVWTSWSSVVW
ncbi:hypothetical protein [Streptomyces sp. HPF1205]|uniref:hypothetical protein n=1 Tax=Streptomyces sp. HPF1205 TaxID=2873262 RepID=UPI001CED870E|nr:hypothetical protein [Streptomyces sp. HPF1205]